MRTGESQNSRETTQKAVSAYRLVSGISKIKLILRKLGKRL